MNPHSPQHSWLRLLVAGLFAVLIFLSILMAPLAQSQTPSPLSTPLPGPPVPQFPDISSLPPRKQEIWLQEWAEYATAFASTPLPPQPFIPTTPEPTVLSDVPRKAAGVGTIVEESQAPFPGSVYHFENQWYTEVGGKVIEVFAGAQRGDGAVDLPRPWQGLVIVVISTPDYSRFFPGEGCEALTPVKVGPVRIVNGKGWQLTLVAEDGTTFVFDVAACQFVSPTLSTTPSLP